MSHHHHLMMTHHHDGDFPEFVLDGVSQRVMKTEEGEAADLAEDGRQRGWHHHHHHHHHRHRHRRRCRRF